MNLFTMAEAANNYSAAGAGKTKIPKCCCWEFWQASSLVFPLW
mgnify:CR=1 FL=1